jgi:hypothetical protein
MRTILRQIPCLQGKIQGILMVRAEPRAVKLCRIVLWPGNSTFRDGLKQGMIRKGTGKRFP